MTITPIWLQKPTKYCEELHSKLIDGAWIERKYDGVSTQATFNQGSIGLYANAKAKVSGQFTDRTDKCPHIIEELKQLEFDNIHLQGEIYSDHLSTEKENFDYTSGILKDHNSYIRQCAEGKTKIVIYDLPSARYSTYKERYIILQDILEGHSFEYVSLAPILGINENDSWIEYFNDMVSKNLEGIVLHQPSALYKYSAKSNGRNPKAFKIKTQNEQEVCVIEKIEGTSTGKFKGTVGKLIALDKNGKQFRIGSLAVTNEMRDYIWNEVECPFIAECRAMSETKLDYRHAVLTRLRLDKDVDSWNKED